MFALFKLPIRRFSQTPSLNNLLSHSKLTVVPGNIIGVGDLNGDGRPDILYKSQAEIATGNGTFKLISEPITFLQSFPPLPM